MSTLRYVGIWSGGEGRYRNGEWSTDAEAYRSVAHAKEVLRYRRAGRMMHAGVAPGEVKWDDEGKPFTTGERNSDWTPDVGDDSTIILAAWDGANLRTLESDGPYACEWQVEFGPRGGVNVLAL